MLKMFIEMALYGVGAVLIAYLVYTLFFSTKDQARVQAQQASKRKRFERREAERGDRRKSEAVPPEGVERRQGPRRSRD